MSDIERAIEHLETYWDSLIDTGLIDCETLCECSNALEKQIPEKVIVISSLETYCPCCDNELINNYYDFSYCEKCGQKLDWSEVEE